MPQAVCKGAQWNFGKFAEEITGKDDTSKGLWEKNEMAYNELWFKNLVAKRIVWKATERVINRQKIPGYRSHPVRPWFCW